MLFLVFGDHSFAEFFIFFFFQAEDGIRDWSVTGVQTCALPICNEYMYQELAKANISDPQPADPQYLPSPAPDTCTRCPCASRDRPCSAPWTTRQIGRASCRERV